MSAIDELIAELCPDGVEYRKLGEVADIGTGSSNTQDQDSDGIYPFYVRSPEVKRSNGFEFDETAIVTAGDGEVGKVFHFVEGKYALHQRAYRVKPTNSTLDAKFLYHYMKANFRTYVERKACSATVKSLRKPMFQNFQIPVPPIEVQREVVRTLDTFSELTTELTTELTCRKQQYAYYRDRLLSRESLEAMDGKPVEMMRLDACGVFERGKRFTKSDYRDNGIPCIHYAEVYTEYQLATSRTVSFVRNEMGESLRFATKGDLVIACTGETKEDIAKSIVWEGEEPVAIHDDCHILHVFNGLDSRYLSYCFQTDSFTKAKIAYATKGKTVRIAASRLASISVPVPSLETQRKVVDILDRFDALTSSLTDGLPAEIEARKAQYEHYRDRLLDFPRKEVAAS